MVESGASSSSSVSSPFPSTTDLSTAVPSRATSPPLPSSASSPKRGSGVQSILRHRARAYSKSKPLKQTGAASSASESDDASTSTPPTMFSRRKYTPLPTSANGGRKRAGGGLTAWKRYAMLGTLVALIFVVGYSMTGHKSRTLVYDGNDAYTPELADANEEANFESPPFVDPQRFPPSNQDKVSGTTSEEAEDIEEHPENPNPVGQTTPQHPPQDDTDPEDEEVAEPVAPVASGNHPTSFETDTNPESTTYCSKPYSSDKPIVQYALTIDAGSTGSRIHVYKFHNCEAMPQLEYETFKAIQPGLSSYKDDPTAAAASLDGLMEEANRVVPKSLQGCTPVEVKATAGLRLLGEEQSAAILEEVRNRLETNYKYTVGDAKAVEIMDGKDEGVYAWITANYLLNKIGGSATADDTLAVMDLGGASTQIVFEPKIHEKSDFVFADGDHKFELTFGGKKFTLYQHSYLGYGLMRARRSVHNLVGFTWSFGLDQLNWAEVAEHIEVPNPCLSRGTRRRVVLEPPGGKPVNVTMYGANGGFEACNRVVELVMDKDAICEVKPCSFDGVYQPSLIDTFPNGKLLALSYFTDRIKPLLPEKQKGGLTVGDLRSLATDVCAGPTAWEKRWGDDKDAMAELEDRPEYCLDLTFMNGLLGLGYELHNDRELIVEKQLNGVELGWALGAGLALVEKADLKCTL